MSTRVTTTDRVRYGMMDVDSLVDVRMPPTTTMSVLTGKSQLLTAFGLTYFEEFNTDVTFTSMFIHFCI